ncbi:MAG TPA: bifunctional hydroxymethylpyrimidine kinase/phosphomethylpyrimidine kinase, partial [Acidimicrobiales bacterium]|nr:bifunctional hydroxymethylpyrimidine kinase/phosphomethylpyrimidine kinase [Acidimicrobiales bacterium]
MDPPVALTVAGSDSGAGAGLQADLKTFAAWGVFGTSVVTAVTAQNTATVVGVEAMAASFVDLQLDAVLGDFRVAAVKTGMLATTDNVVAVAHRAAAGALPNLVVDPVLASSSGTPLLPPEGVGAYRDLLLPHALVATPNLREAQLLTDRQVSDVDGMVEAARTIAAWGPSYVVVKGGHLEGALAPDVVVHGDEVTVLEGPRIPTRNDHGTGCTLAAATAAGLAWGRDPREALVAAKRYVAEALAGAADWRLGAGHGPLDHFG